MCLTCRCCQNEGLVDLCAGIAARVHQSPTHVPSKGAIIVGDRIHCWSRRGDQPVAIHRWPPWKDKWLPVASQNLIREHTRSSTVAIGERVDSEPHRVMTRRAVQDGIQA